MQSSFKKHFQQIVFRKLSGWKLEKSCTKKYTCHLGIHQRSPRNTNGKKNWVQNMLNDQKLGNCLGVSNRTNQFQIQVVRERRDPLLKTTREPCKMEEKRPVLRRSMLILFTKKLFLREKTERPVVETSAIQTRSSEDSKDTNVETAHERTRRLVVETNTENVPDSCQTRSCHKSETFNVGDKTLRERTVRPVVNHDDSSHEQTMLNEVNIDFRIPGLPHSVVKHARRVRAFEN